MYFIFLSLLLDELGDFNKLMVYEFKSRPAALLSCVPLGHGRMITLESSVQHHLHGAILVDVGEEWRILELGVENNWHQYFWSLAMLRFFVNGAWKGF